MHFTQTFAAATFALAGAAAAKEVVVQVSNQDAGLFYNKNDVRAAVGDTVKFIFNPANHTVTEAAFNAPCVPLAGGFNSGFRPTAKDAAEQDTFTYKVADDRPHWFYCAQGPHCKRGMVGVINPPQAKPENNINSFAANAAAANQTKPGLTVSGGWLGKISKAEASAYLSQANPAWMPNNTGTAAPSSTLNLVINTNTAAPTGIQTEYAVTNAQGQVMTTTVQGTVKEWGATTYTQAVTSVNVNGAIETGIAQVTAQIPKIAQSNDAPAGFANKGVAAVAGLAAGAAAMLIM